MCEEIFDFIRAEELYLCKTLYITWHVWMTPVETRKKEEFGDICNIIKFSRTTVH